jgi:hypothetical protein
MIKLVNITIKNVTSKNGLRSLKIDHNVIVSLTDLQIDLFSLSILLNKCNYIFAMKNDKSDAQKGGMLYAAPDFASFGHLLHVKTFARVRPMA